MIWCVITVHHHKDLCATPFCQLPLEKSCRQRDFLFVIGQKESTGKVTKNVLLLCSTVDTSTVLLEINSKPLITQAAWL